MKLFPRSAFSIVLLLITVIAKSQGIPQKEFLIYNAQIIDVLTGKIKKENAVLIEGQQIKALGDFNQLSKGISQSQRLDVKNKFIIPGLWDMHIHLEGHELVEDNRRG